MGKIISRRQKLYDIKGFDKEYPSTTLPIKRLVAMENASCKNGKLGRFDHLDGLRDINGREIPPPPHLFYNITQYGGSDGTQNILIASGSFGVFKYDLRKDSAWVTLTEDEILAIECVNIDNRPVMYLPTYRKTYTYDGRNFVIQENATEQLKVFTHMTTHYGRVFAATGMQDCKLYFSDETDPLNWRVSIDEGGYLKFDLNTGVIIGLVSFNDYLYVFTKRAIYRITAYGVQEDFVIKKIDDNIGTVYEGSVCKCRDRIMFMSTLGLAAFDGYSVKVIFPEFSQTEIDRKTAVRSCAKNNKYYLALGKNIVIVDYENACYTIDDYNYDVGVACDLANDRVIVYTRHNPHGVSGTAMECYVNDKKFTSRLFRFESGELDFGDASAKKVIKKIHIAPEVRGAFIIKADDVMRCYSLYGDKTLPINMSGYKFKIIFRGFALALNCASPLIEYDIIS